jgi:hypothetical protein
LKDGDQDLGVVQGEDGDGAVGGISAQASGSGKGLPELGGRLLGSGTKALDETLDRVTRKADRAVISLSWRKHF